MAAPIIPRNLERVEIFFSREVFVNGPEAQTWKRESGTPTLAEQINAWVDKTCAKILSVSAPNVCVYREKVPGVDPLAEREIRFTAASIVYLPAVEGHKDGEQSSTALG